MGEGKGQVEEGERVLEKPEKHLIKDSHIWTVQGKQYIPPKHFLLSCDVLTGVCLVPGTLGAHHHPQAGQYHVDQEHL